ncbi:MAG: sigma-70 family RNA polymerase sigma factor [Planctomycetes bacterium]|nr:sigma-70 family RNA polymerase sigma factor [Planctomycetota bacterium]
MKIRELDRLIKSAEEQGAFRMDQLDEALAEDRVFEKNMNHLIRRLGEIPIYYEADEKEETTPARKSGYRRFQYLKEVSMRPRMNREEEVLFSKRLEFFKNRILRAVKKSDLSENEKARILRNVGCPSLFVQADAEPYCKDLHFCPSGKDGVLKHSCASYSSVRKEFIERNLYLVVSVAQSYSTYGVPVQDLIQEGNTALIRAVEKFDWRKEVRFQTYAALWLRQAIERFITANRCIVRLPNYLQQKMRRFKREGKISSDRSDLSVDEVSVAFSLSTKIAGRLLETDRGHVSLDAPTSQIEMGSLADTLFVEDEEPTPDTEHHHLKKRLSNALATLTQQEKYILAHRFGLEGKPVKTLEELGGFLNVSRERIRQLQIKAIEKLKKPTFTRQLAPFLS